MGSSIISAWLVLLSATACISQVRLFSDYSDYYLLEDAILKDNVNLLKQLLDNGTDAKAISYDGETALYHAARFGTQKIVELLIPVSDVKATYNNGDTALMRAAEHGTDKIVELLLPGSDAKAASKYGFTALMLATRWGTDKMVELLIPVSDVKATNNDGQTALDIAKSWGPRPRRERDRIVQLLSQAT